MILKEYPHQVSWAGGTWPMVLYIKYTPYILEGLRMGNKLSSAKGNSSDSSRVHHLKALGPVYIHKTLVSFQVFFLGHCIFIFGKSDSVLFEEMSLTNLQ